ncbi:MAG: HigA family addiction module antitoxin [Planctomycetales bacterium]
MAGRATKRERYAYEPDYVTEPGEILQETIDSLGIKQKELAARTGYSPKHINQLIKGIKRISPEAALRLEKVTRVPARFWNNLEAQYQERKARLADCESSPGDLAWLREVPTKELIKRGAIEDRKDQPGLLQSTLTFFGVASVAAFRKGWGQHQIAFRKSSGAEKCTGGIAAWVRLAELEAASIECKPFDSRKFDAALRKTRELTVKVPDEFVPAMQKFCAAAGIAVVLVPEIPGSRVSGAAKWLTPHKAMIALNLRGKRNDLFWFTFFHEAGHILNDGRDEVFVDVDYADDPREQAANQFAGAMLIPAIHDDELPDLKSKSAVRSFANRIGVHPGIVVGRLQHDKIIPFTHMNDLKDRLRWSED